MQQKESKTNWHFYTSLTKSIIRMGAGVALMNNWIFTAGVSLIIAEMLGILEEL